ncbi:hypothetical protein C5167_048427 [Papaver somniferum]|uniref:SHSP domain-containing protein n=1 Tax=Papaver somniferum TaxID=3469 RepID=A0A4Y7KHX7_PAPSO|nr:hypothetical protein C5167_048427 [Papaver somniferum]
MRNHSCSCSNIYDLVVFWKTGDPEYAWKPPKDEWHSIALGYTSETTSNPKAETPADIKEYPDSYVFLLDMPGLKSEEIKVQVENNNVLVVTGMRQREDEKDKEVKYVRMERRIGKLMRKFVLPENANIDAVSAVCVDGVLTITVHKLPPPEPKKPRTIQVQIG